MSRINSLNPFPFIAQWCTDPSDTDEIQLQKTLLVASTMMMGSFGIIWSMVYFLLAQPLAAVIPLIYSLLSAISLLVFAATRKYNFFRSSQLLVELSHVKCDKPYSAKASRNSMGVRIGSKAILGRTK